MRQLGLSYSEYPEPARSRIRLRPTRSVALSLAIVLTPLASAVPVFGQIKLPEIVVTRKPKPAPALHSSWTASRSGCCGHTAEPTPTCAPPGSALGTMSWATWPCCWQP